MNPLTSGVSTNEAARRVQAIPAPIVSPGNCGICGKHEHPDGFADARLDFEFYGTLYFCADCVGEFARAFGWINETQYQSLLDSIENQGKMLAWYEAKFSKIEAILGEQYVPIDFDGLSNVTDISDVDAGDSEDDSNESTDAERHHFTFDPAVSRGKPTTLQLVSEQESVGVPSDSGNDDSTDPLGL